MFYFCVSASHLDDTDDPAVTEVAELLFADGIVAFGDDDLPLVPMRNGDPELLASFFCCPYSPEGAFRAYVTSKLRGYSKCEARTAKEQFRTVARAQRLALTSRALSTFADTRRTNNPQACGCRFCRRTVHTARHCS